MADSYQDKLKRFARHGADRLQGRDRRSGAHLELPFVVGVMADLSRQQGSEQADEAATLR